MQQEKPLFKKVYCLKSIATGDTDSVCPIDSKDELELVRNSMMSRVSNRSPSPN